MCAKLGSVALVMASEQQFLQHQSRLTLHAGRARHAQSRSDRTFTDDVGRLG